MPRSRSERRRRSGLVVDVFSSNMVLGWTIIRQAPVEVAVEQLALKKWREIWSQDGEFLGVQPLLSLEQRKTRNLVLTEQLVAVTITLEEVKRCAGLYGKSRTIGLSEWQRAKRHARYDDARILPPEDAIERAIEKVKQWPFPQSVRTDEHGVPILDDHGAPTFGDKAVRVYPLGPSKQ